MREFEKYEMFKTKCPVCGSKNKVHTELMNINDNFAGYSLKCCNCGNYNQFLLDHHTNGRVIQWPYKNGKQRCIQFSYCPRKDCALYGTCNLDCDSVDFEENEQNNCVPGDDEVDNTAIIEVVNTPRFL